MKKVITIVWTRPELIRLSEIIKVLDVHTHHIFVHTGQNFTPNLHDNFFDELKIRKPDYQFNTQARSGFEFIWNMYMDIDNVLEKEQPDVVLILWDTNSALSAYVAKRKSIPVFHMEAWNRCYDDRVPEEVNRRIVDSLSEYLLPYTQRSREQLLQEWYHPSKIIVTWNPITEVIQKHLPNIPSNEETEKYVLVTLHRQENVTIKENLEWLFTAFSSIANEKRVILSLHPKLEEMMKKFKITPHKNIILAQPFWFKKFLSLEKYADCVLSDSWTVPEECNILWTPCVLLRTSTERPELLENNSMILSGIKAEEILQSYNVVMRTSTWEIPADYKDGNVSEKILKLILRHI